MTAESKSLFNYGNDISRGRKSEKSGLGFLAMWAWVWDSRNKRLRRPLVYKYGQFDNKTQDLTNIPCSAAHIRLCPLWNKIMQLMVFFIRLPVAKSKN